MPQLTRLKRGLTLLLVLLANLAWNTGPVASFNTNPAQPLISLEQLFIPQPLALEGADLVITGHLVSTSTIKTKSKDWIWWLDGTGGASGRMRVSDAQGLEIPTRFKRLGESVQLTINGPTLVAASYPITIESEIGSNDFRISDMGPNGDLKSVALYPAVAYNSTNNEYLVVWQADDNTGSLVNGETEIFGQRLSASGAEIGANDFRISDMGPDGNSDFDAAFPTVTYNSTANEYLVVWQADDNTGLLVDGEFEIYGQRLSATGAEIGTNDFRISDMGPDGNSGFDAAFPVVAYASATNEYLVVWGGNDNTGSLANSELEIFGQRLNTAGAEIGTNDFRISDMGPNGNETYFADAPRLVYNSTTNQYLVVWWGTDNIGGLVSNETEIFGQQLSATGAEIGANDFRISDMGPDGNTDFGAVYPVVAHNSTTNQYLVIWQADDNTGLLVDGEFEIYGQRLSATGAEIGTNDFRISDMGPDGNPNFDALYPSVGYNTTDNEYLAVWLGDDNTGSLVEGEDEVFGQRLNASGGQIEVNDFRISDMGPEGNPGFDAFYPGVAYSSTANEYLAVWDGIDLIGAPETVESEIFGQRLTPEPQSANPDQHVFLPIVLKNN